MTARRMNQPNGPVSNGIAAVAATTIPAKAAYARMCPTRSMIRSQRNAPNVKPAK